jgi:hypothetical protein
MCIFSEVCLPLDIEEYKRERLSEKLAEAARASLKDAAPSALSHNAREPKTAVHSAAVRT